MLVERTGVPKSSFQFDLVLLTQWGAIPQYLEKKRCRECVENLCVFERREESLGFREILIHLGFCRKRVAYPVDVADSERSFGILRVPCPVELDSHSHDVLAQLRKPIIVSECEDVDEYAPEMVVWVAKMLCTHY
jgi:hypothetical protein